MNLEVEFARANARVRRGIRRNTERALRRIDEATPSEIRDGIRKPPIVEALESFHEAAVTLSAGFAAFAAAVSAATTEASREEQHEH